MDFIFRIQNHYFEKGTPWVELDKIKHSLITNIESKARSTSYCRNSGTHDK
jgi:hypothetical protein